jgi:hypothetical protein
MALERIIKTSPPFDKRNPDPAKDYGIGSMKIRYIVKGDKGAISFTLNTGGYMENVAKEKPDLQGYVQGWDVSYHGKNPVNDSDLSSVKCDILDGGECYNDGSALHGEEVGKIFVLHGEDKLWEYLEKYYKEIFGSEEE